MPEGSTQGSSMPGVASTFPAAQSASRDPRAATSGVAPVALPGSACSRPGSGGEPVRVELTHLQGALRHTAAAPIAAHESGISAGTMLDALDPLLTYLADPKLPLALALGVALPAVVVLAIVARKARRTSRRLRREAEARQRQEALEAARASEAGMAELRGRLITMAEMTAGREAQLAESLDRRLDQISARLGDGLQSTSDRLSATLDGLSHRLGQGLAETGQHLGSSLADASQRTADSLTRLYERLALIDQAQASLTDLSSQVVTLRSVLDNKQARGAFGQMRMEAIIEDGLPRGTYELQATLSNGRRPDCLVRLPSATAPLVIDAKFPLEGFEALRVAHGPEEVQSASQRVREAVGRHIDDIASKYLIPGETQETALLFVPSESILGELSERFPDLMQQAHRSRVVIVSPNMLMLAVQTMQAILKDVRMREQAGLIQREVGLLMEDVGRLAERVRELDRHFTLATKDVERLLSATDKVAQRGRRIASADLGEAPAIEAGDPPRLAAV